MHDYYWNPLYLDLYEQRGRLPRTPVTLPDGLFLPESPGIVDADGSLYSLQVGVVLPIGAELDESSLMTCLAADGSDASDVMPRDQRPVLTGNGRLQQISLSTLCPSGTTHLRITAEPVLSVGGRLIDASLSRLEVS
jgi:hypothetical protein